jgi:fibronectin-binding autotransporter adhesin
MSGTNKQASGSARVRIISGRLLCTSSLSALALFALPSVAHAQDQNRTWDPNGTAVGSGGTGNWNTTDSTWSPNGDGVSGPFSPWNNAAVDNAIFGGTASTVTLDLPITVHNLSFASDGYVLNGPGTLGLGGTTPTITTSAGTATINSAIAGTAGLIKAGAGTLRLTGANTFSGGLTVNSGTLSVNGDAALGAASNGVTIAANGSTFSSDTALAASRVVTMSGSGDVYVGGAVGSARFTGNARLVVYDKVVTLTNVNDYTGATYVGASAYGFGSLTFNSIADAGVASALGSGSTITVVGGGVNNTNAVYTGGAASTNRSWAFSSSTYGSGILYNQGSGTLTLTGDVSLTRNVQMHATTADIALNGVVSGGWNEGIIFNGGVGRTISIGGVSNTYVGATTIYNVTVEAKKFANTGAASSLGAGGTNLINLFNGSTLSYTGSGDASDRDWAAVNGTLRNDGTGALALSGDIGFGGGTFTLGGSYVGASTLSGVISAPGNLIMNGAAGNVWELTGANSFTGTTTIQSGTLRLGNTAALGNNRGVIVNGGALDLNGVATTVASLAGTGGSVALTGADLIVKGTANTSYAGSLSGGSGLVKAGAGTQTLTGQSTYTGATTIGGGTLALNFSAGGAPASNIISNTSTLNMAGGALTVTGAAGQTQTFAATNVTAGSNTITGTGNVTVNLGAITRSSGLVNFVLPTTGNITTTPSTTLGGWATVSSGNVSDYAQVDGSGNIIARTVYQNKDDVSTWMAGDVVSDTANATNSPYFGTVSGTLQLGGLKYTAAAPSTVTVGGTLGVDGTIIVSSSVGANTQTITGGRLTGPTGGATLGILQNSTGNLAIASTIVDNAGATGFTKAGTGLVTLSGPNNYTGATTVSGGALSVNSVANGGQASAIGASSATPSNLVLEGGTLQYTGGATSSDRGFTLVTNGAVTGGTINVSLPGTNLTFSGQVTSPDNAGLTKTGTGTLTLANAANNYVGATTISGGTLSATTLANGGQASSIGASSSTSSNLVLQSGGTLQYTGGTISTSRGFTLGTGGGGIGVNDGGATLTMSGAATGTGGLTKSGAGTLVLSGTNTYTGGNLVSAGLLRAGSISAFGTGAMNLLAGAALDLANNNNTIGGLVGAGNVTLGSATLTINNNGNAFSGRISGTGGVTIAAGTQVMTGCSNSYTGVTTINGTLSVGCLRNGGQASDVGASTSGSNNLQIDGILNYTGGSATTDRGFALTSGRITVANAATALEFSGAATGTQLEKTGSGTLVLSGSNTYGGGTYVNGGILRAGSTSAFGASGLQMDTTSSTLDLNNFNNAVAYISQFNTSFTGGNITLGSATLTISNGSSGNYNGAISGTGGLVKNGAGTQTLSGAGSSYTSATMINGGVLAVASLANGGANSSIGASTSAPGSLILNGGTLQYAGTGGSTDRQFTLGASGGGLDASGTGAISFASLTPITLSDTGNRTLTLTGASAANNTLAARIDNPSGGTTALTKSGTGIWILTNPNSSYTGITTISGGVLGVDKLSNGGGASSIGASSAAASNLIIGNGSTLRYTGTGDTTNRLFTLSSGVTFIESSGTGAVVFTDTGPVTMQTNNVARTIALGGTNAGNNTLAGSIGDAGTGVTTLAKSDAGTWVLTGTNTYTGPTNINAGILTVGGGSTTGAIATSTVNNFGTLGFNRSDALNYAGTITGTGSVHQVGTGTTILTGTSNYTGGTTIGAGVLQLGSGDVTGSIVGNVTNNGILAFNRSNAYTLAGVISGSGAVTQIGSGTTTLTGTNTYAGGTTINAGTLQVSSDANLGAASGGLGFNGGTLNTTVGFASARAVDLIGASTFLTDAGTTLALSGAVSGAGSLSKSGTGTLTLSGSNSYTGATIVSAGTLIVNGNQSLSTGATGVASGAALGGSGTIGGNAAIAGGAALSPGNSPGTLTIAGNLTLDPASQVNFELGQAGVAGGPLNDLVNVGGNLTLDGTLNVTQSAGGTFGRGIYRLFNYSGALTNNVLDIAGAPAGLTVQTSVANQVNLINTQGLVLRYWDGNAGPKDNGVVNGGAGTWQASSGNDNWTDVLGTPNGGFLDSSIPVFQGTAGTVTVDDSLGAINVSGLQFVTSGYTIQGDAINMVEPQTVIQVGDGTPAETGYVATINAQLVGAGQLAKADGGTLVLGGANTYTGGTAIFSGTLRVASDGNLGAAAGGITLNGGTLNTTASMASARTVAVNSASTVLTDAGTTLTLSGAISGAGGLTKSGTGTLTLTGDAAHTGGTIISAGTLRVGTGGATASIAGNIVNNAALIFNRTGTLAYAGDISGSGTVTQLGAGTTILTGDATHTGGTTVSAGTLQVGDGGATGSLTGNVAVNGLTTLLAFNRSDDISFGGVISGDGTVSKRGAGALALTGTSNFRVLLVDGGEVEIASGNTVTVTGTTLDGPMATVTVSGTGSRLVAGSAILLRDTGLTGTLNVENGGVVTASSLTAANSDAPAGGMATINVNGLGSLLDVSGTFVLNRASNSATANMNVTNAGVVRSNSGSYSSYFGVQPTPASVTVSGAGSSWEIATNFSMSSGGSLSILDGGRVSAGGVFTNGGFGSTDVLVSGSGSLLSITGEARFQASGGPRTQVLTLADGGRFTVDGPLQFAYSAGATTILNIGGREGQAATAAGTLDAATLVFGPGTSRINFNHTEAGNTFGNAIAGNTSVNQVAGTTILTGTNSYTGGTTIGGGTLVVSGDTNLGSAASAVAFNGGTLRTTATFTTARGATLAAGGGIVQADADLTWSGGITGIGALTKTGAGSLILTGTNNYTGATTISAGTLQIGDGGTSGSIVGEVINNAALVFYRSDGVSFGSVISGSGSLTHIGTGTLTLTGANSYAGGTTIDDGTLQISSDANLGDAAGGLTMLNGGTLHTTADITSARDIVVFSSPTGSPRFSTDAGTTLTLTGGITGSGGVNKLGGGTLILSGTNSYAGNTNVNSGTLLVNGDNSAATGETFVTNATLGGAGTIGGDVLLAVAGRLAPGSNGVGALTITGDLRFASSSNRLLMEFGAANAPGSPLNDAVKVGGDLTLAGRVDVAVSPGGSFGPGVYRMFNYGGTLIDNGMTVGTLPSGTAFVQTAIAKQVNLVNTAGLTLNFWDGAAGPKNDGLIQGGDGIWRAGGGQNNWTEVNGTANADYAQDSFAAFQGTGGTVIVDNVGGNVSAAGMQFAVGGYTVAGGPLTLTGTDAFVRVGDGSAGDAGLTATISASLAGSARLVKDLGGTLVLTGANTYTGGTAINGGTLRIANDANLGDAAGGLAFNGGTLNTTASFDSSRGIDLVGTGTFDPDAATALNLDGVISGAGALIKQGDGILNLTADNSYTGGTTIAAGSLQIGNGGTTGSVLGNIVDNGELILARSDSYTIAGQISGAGAVRKGGGTAIFTADNSYTGGTTNGSGILQLGDGGTTGSITGDLINAGTLLFNRSNELTFAGVISGPGGVDQAGSGTTILTGANSYTGTTNVTAGTLLVNGNQTDATGLTTVDVGATLGGTGTIGGDVTVAGTLAPGHAAGPGTLTINGSLALGAGSVLAFEFGQADVVGGALNDLVEVGGNLTLDGTIDVSIPATGSFGPGLYRVFNYGGTLTDKGLALGTMPGGSTVSVQTAVAGQVNLVDTAGLALSFWDGDAGPKNNGAIEGGNGTWSVGGGNSSWTELTGQVNADYAQDSFAVFTGAPGTVTVDNSAGNVLASGFQFASDGYTITGDALTLTGSQSIVQVGDGSVAGGGFTATISSELTGSAGLVKTDAGTLVLTGASSYTGGTAVNGGTLRVSSDANLGAAAGGLTFNGGTLNTTASFSSGRAVNLAGAGTLLTDAGTTLTLNGATSGAGALTKSGTGTLVLGGAGNHTGGMNVVAGTLLINGNHAATGATSVAAGATLGGTGTIGGSVALADGATLAAGNNSVGTLTINGGLGLSSGSQLAYEFGQANVAGGTLNDLVNVGGNLTLDGTINVTSPAGGAFDAGVYRVFNYGGALTNNGLTLGSVPGASNVSVQTSIAGQVNLVNSAGLTLGFWDGAAGPKNNGVINGGTGTWQSGTGNDNWTDAGGLVNAAYSNGTFAVFGGMAGTVTVDNGPGQVTASGMQFAANGYTITGNAVALTGPQSTIRVGDGSTAGAGFTATISSVLSGDTQLVKTDAGTLVLNGTNGYTGGTAINGGTLQIAADANLGAASGNVTLNGGTLATSANLNSNRGIDLAGAGTISTAGGTTFTFNGLLSGTGALTKTGAGTLLLTGDSSGFAGSTRVDGILTVNGSLCGDVNVRTGGRLQGTGTVCTTVNAGTIATGNSIGTLTVAGNYTGNGGTLEVEAELGGDASPADRLVVNGATSGTTQVVVINQGGLGAATVEGIKIVDVGGASNGVFTLNGDYVFEGDQAVIAGAYGYRLQKNGVSTPTDGDWYLRSSLLDAPTPNTPNVPLYQPGVPVYEAYGQTLLALNELGTLQQRTGDRRWAQTQSGRPSGIWGRMQSNRSRRNAAFSTSLTDVNLDSWKAELGADQVLSERSDGASLVLGVLGGYSEANVSVASLFGNGSIKTKSYSAGATLSWFGPQGFYVDGRAQVTWFDSKLRSAVLGKLAEGNNGTSQAYSVEVGKRAPVGSNLSVTPQIQMAYSTVGFDRFTDPNGATVSSKLGDSLKTRWGVALDRQDAKRHLYGVANLSYEWLDGTVTDVSGTPIARQNHRLWGELGVGGSLLLGDRLTLYTEASANTAVNDFGKSYSLKGTAGLRLAF